MVQTKKNETQKKSGEYEVQAYELELEKISKTHETFTISDFYKIQADGNRNYQLEAVQPVLQL